MQNLRQRKQHPSTNYGLLNNTHNNDKQDDDSKKKVQQQQGREQYFGQRDINLTILGSLTLASLFIRLFKISNPSQVVFDEVHFGGFASKYIKGAFFMDVHPPLGKLLISAAGLAAGFNGTFDFKEIGMDYIEPNVPYISMRLLPGILGCAIVPMAYITMRNIGSSQIASVLAALFVLLENGLACQSRLVLLDSILVFFTAMTMMMWTDFLTSRDKPFSFGWWYPLIMTGLGLGLAASVKWVGLFIIATIGVSTIKNLWDIIDENISFGLFAKHFCARAYALIFCPIIVYMAIFELHFLVLKNSGSGNGFMSPEFQSTLGGVHIEDAYQDVGYYSEVYIRHDGTNGGYLHSHRDLYPTGSKQQQVTCYPFHDENSLFHILPPLEQRGNKTVESVVEGFEKIKHGSIIRLHHVRTGKKLHSHDVRAPVTDNEYNQEVSGYGIPDFIGDTNDHWRVEVDDNGDLKAITSRFRLIHVNTHCALFSHNVKLPEWGFEQQEVTCAKEGKRKLTNWRIESNLNSLLPDDALKVNYKTPGFFGKFFESHQVMWDINNGLTSSHPYDSRPSSWPFLKRGISFWTSKSPDPSSTIYLLGNPFVWILGTISLVVYTGYNAITAVLLKRQLIKNEDFFLGHKMQWAGLMFSAWALHYFPFFIMQRQLFLHHYFPALYFSILCFAVVFDGITGGGGLNKRRGIKFLLFVGCCILTIYHFYKFAPLTFGFPMTKNQCESLKYRESWDFDCSKMSTI